MKKIYLILLLSLNSLTSYSQGIRIQATNTSYCKLVGEELVCGEETTDNSIFVLDATNKEIRRYSNNNNNNTNIFTILSSIRDTTSSGALRLTSKCLSANNLECTITIISKDNYSLLSIRVEKLVTVFYFDET